MDCNKSDFHRRLSCAEYNAEWIERWLEGLSLQINRLAALIKTNNECQNIAESLNCHSSARNPCKGLVNEVKSNKYNLKNRRIQEKERKRER